MVEGDKQSRECGDMENVEQTKITKKSLLIKTRNKND